MRREELVDLNAFMTVAEEQNFTRAAARLGTSQSALSHTIRRLDARLGVRLCLTVNLAGRQLLLEIIQYCRNELALHEV